jgi:hypothetical protein
MGKVFTINRTEVVDGPLVSFGPIEPDSEIQLAMPSRFERRISYQGKNLELVITCEFAGDKVAVRSLRLTNTDGGGVGTRDLTQLSLPSLVHQISLSVIPNSQHWTKPLSNEAASWAELRTSDVYVAQVYWLEHVSHGNPRATLMQYFGMPRSSCNLLLRKLRLKFKMPRTS